MIFKSNLWTIIFIHRLLQAGHYLGVEIKIWVRRYQVISTKSKAKIIELLTAPFLVEISKINLGFICCEMYPRHQRIGFLLELGNTEESIFWSMPFVRLNWQNQSCLCKETKPSCLSPSSPHKNREEIDKSI